MTAAERTPRGRLHRAAIAVYGMAVLWLTVAVFVNSLGWVNGTFPGFFIMENLVIPSAGLPHWNGIKAANVYQRLVVAIEDRPATSAAAAYRQIAEQPPDTPFHYTLRAGGTTENWTINSMRFALSDYVSVFGAYFLNGIIFTAVGIVVWILGPRSAATVGTVALALTAGAFSLTGVDLYGPGYLFRLHVTTESLFPAALLHLALVFPVARLGRYRRPLLAAIYLADLIVIGFYQEYLYEPERYSTIHNVCTAGVGLAGAGLIVSGVQAYFANTSLLVRRRLGIVLLGTVAGFAIPAWMMTMSGFSGGDRAINLAAFTAFLFPLSLAYAVVKLDLFEIDAMLRRGINYLVLTAAVVAIYVILVLGLGFVLQTASLGNTLAYPLIFSVLMILLFNPMRDRIQKLVDRLYYRTQHNAQKTLERASGALVATLNLDEICTLTLETICRALLIDQASLWLRNEHGQFQVVRGRGPRGRYPGALDGNHPMIERLRRGSRVISVYDFAEGIDVGPAERACQKMLSVLNSELVVPFMFRGELSGLITLGAKKSKTLFTLDDIDFLQTFANQVAVAILNAQSYRKIEELNIGLEQKIAQRTGELGQTNTELARSLRELEEAYNELQHSKEKLLRVENMAALGRVTAGIAHEVNTPLGASLNSLKLLEELVQEYASSIGDPDVNEDDHREIATELQELVGNVLRWTNKAASYIVNIKAHTRNLEGVQERQFEVMQLIEDTRLLLSHRLRFSCCSLTVECPPSVTLYGDPGKLGQVLTNLITNAMDAYDGHGNEDGNILIQVFPRAGGMEIAVEDQGCGIEAEHMDRIFEDLFTTKPPGKGTGLGLSISRAIMNDCFGGRIDVTSKPGAGSRFALWIPRRQPPEGQAREERRAAASA